MQAIAAKTTNTARSPKHSNRHINDMCKKLTLLRVPMYGYTQGPILQVEGLLML